MNLLLLLNFRTPELQNCLDFVVTVVVVVVAVVVVAVVVVFNRDEATLLAFMSVCRSVG